MKKAQTLSGVHLLDKNFWNRPTLPTHAVDVVLIPIRDIWENQRGKKKKKLFTKGKPYKGIHVGYSTASGYGWKRLLDHLALKDNFGDGRKIAIKTLFIVKSARENALDELGI